MNQYHQLLRDVLDNGSYRGDRTGTGTFSVFGRQIRFDLRKGFPLVTTKKVHFHSVVHELLWFLRGETNIQYLHENNVHIWDEWADAQGHLGPVYGAQWRSWYNHSGDIVDQIANLIDGLKSDPYSRRHIVSAWNVGELDLMALAPCHCLFQFYVTPAATEDEMPSLSCQLYQRSADLFLGVPFNIASYALLTHMVAKVCGFQVGEFVHTFGDAHIYANHLNQVEEQLSRESYDLPQLFIKGNKTNIDSISAHDIVLQDYVSHPSIKAPVAV